MAEKVLPGAVGISGKGEEVAWKRAWEGEYSANTAYTNMLMEKLCLLNLFQAWGE
jgi:hypothetical protein